MSPLPSQHLKASAPLQSSGWSSAELGGSGTGSTTQGKKVLRRKRACQETTSFRRGCRGACKEAQVCSEPTAARSACRPSRAGSRTQPHGETWVQQLPPCPQYLQAGAGETGEEALSLRCLVPSRNIAFPQDAVPMARQMSSPGPKPPRDNRPVPPSRAAAPHTLPTPTATAHSQALPRALHLLPLLWLQRDWSPRPPQLHIVMPTSIPHLCPGHPHLCSLFSCTWGSPLVFPTVFCPSIQPHPIPVTPSFYLQTCPSCSSWVQPYSSIRFIPIPSLRPPPFTSRPAPAAAGGCSPAATRRRGGSSRGGRGRCPWCCRRCPWCRRRSRTRTT